MAYPSPNYTQCPNLFLDEHLPDMGYAEVKVVLAVIRQTFGWHKTKDQLSLSQLEALTGLSRRAVIDGVQAALKRGVLQREPDGDSYRYWLAVHQNGSEVTSPGSEATSPGVVKQLHQGSEATSPVGSEVASPTKERVKETPTKERGKESAHAHEGLIRDSDPPSVQTYIRWIGKRPTAIQQGEIKAKIGQKKIWEKVCRRTALDMDDPTKAYLSIMFEEYDERLANGGERPRRNGRRREKERRKSWSFGGMNDWGKMAREMDEAEGVYDEEVTA